MNGDNVGVLSCDQICSPAGRAVQQQQQQDCHYRRLARMQQHPPASTQHDTHKHQQTSNKVRCVTTAEASVLSFNSFATGSDHQSTSVSQAPQETVTLRFKYLESWMNVSGIRFRLVSNGDRDYFLYPYGLLPMISSGSSFTGDKISPWDQFHIYHKLSCPRQIVTIVDSNTLSSVSRIS